MNSREIARLIDHTNLRPDAADADIVRLADEAVRHGFWSVCVNTRHVGLLARELRETDVRITTVTGFPLGASHPSAKAIEASEAVEQGAHEVDMVLSLGDLLSGRDDRVLEEIRLVRGAVPRAVLKVILECGLLTDEQKRDAARIAVDAGADFVKTSTGFGRGRATEADVRLLRETVGPDVGVKASGGIRTREQAVGLIRAGASRLGTSSGKTIIGVVGVRPRLPDRPERRR